MHAACGFYNSGFETAACVIADGAGSFLQIGDIQDTCYEFETIFNASYPGDFDTVYKHVGTKQSIGMSEPEDNIFVTEYPGHTKMYEAVTQYCGFPAIEAGKLMGLAPYGSPNEDLPSFFNGEWGNRNLIIPTYPNAALLNVARYDILKEDVKNHVNGEYTDVQKDLAYKIQEQTSDRMVQLIKKAHELTGEKNIVICGGYGLNCVANYKYWKEFPDLNIYCEPISHDGGTSIGGAKYTYNKLNETEKPSKQESVYYGPQYDPTGYMADLEGLEVTDTSYDDVAKLIREGTIVTIYQGRSEGGPRALGNRSILFDPTIKDGKDHVNAVKHREWFRPFACSIKKEAVHDWFDLAGRDETPHMMYAVKCHDGVEEKIPSVIHVDNTCRIQTVTPEQNEHYYNLIDAFDKIAGVPILFNTSFNLGGDPLVETIEDAVNTLNKSDIEWMYLPEIQKLVHVPNE
jgi:carbamoyltransferase